MIDTARVTNAINAAIGEAWGPNLPIYWDENIPQTPRAPFALAAEEQEPYTFSAGPVLYEVVHTIRVALIKSTTQNMNLRQAKADDIRAMYTAWLSSPNTWGPGEDRDVLAAESAGGDDELQGAYSVTLQLELRYQVEKIPQ